MRGWRAFFIDRHLQFSLLKNFKKGQGKIIIGVQMRWFELFLNHSSIYLVLSLRKSLLKIFSRIKKYTVFFYMTSFALVLCMKMGKEGLWFDELILILSVIQCSALFPMRLDNVTFVGKCLSFSYWWMLYTLLPNDPIGQLKGLFTLFF